MRQVDEVLDARVAPPTSVDARVGVHLLSDLEFERDGGNARSRDAGEGQQIGTFDQVGGVHQEFAERHVNREGVEAPTGKVGGHEKSTATVVISRNALP